MSWEGDYSDDIPDILGPTSYHYNRGRYSRPLRSSGSEYAEYNEDISDNDYFDRYIIFILVFYVIIIVVLYVLGFINQIKLSRLNASGIIISGVTIIGIIILSRQLNISVIGILLFNYFLAILPLLFTTITTANYSKVLLFTSLISLAVWWISFRHIDNGIYFSLISVVGVLYYVGFNLWTERSEGNKRFIKSFNNEHHKQ